MMINKFVEVPDKNYDSVRDMARAVSDNLKALINQETNRLFISG